MDKPAQQIIDAKNIIVTDDDGKEATLQWILERIMLNVIALNEITYDLVHDQSTNTKPH